MLRRPKHSKIEVVTPKEEEEEDDMLVLGRLVRAIEVVVTQIKEAAVSTGLVINESKTKYMKLNINITC